MIAFNLFGGRRPVADGITGRKEGFQAAYHPGTVTPPFDLPE
jgi:hypothetical protein